MCDLLVAIYDHRVNANVLANDHRARMETSWIFFVSYDGRKHNGNDSGMCLSIHIAERFKETGLTLTHRFGKRGPLYIYNDRLLGRHRWG